MKFKITVFALLFTGVVSHAQVQDSIAPIQEEYPVMQSDQTPLAEEPDAEESTEKNWDYSYFERAEMDTVVKYRNEVFPFVRIGFGNVSADNQFSHSDFGYMRSGFFEWGITVRKPFNENKNLLGLRYGISFSYQHLTPTGNNVFVTNGDQTVLEEYPVDLRRNHSYFKNSYINIPIALDFDFSTKKYNHANRRFDVEEGINFGVGGYIGYNINSKQFISYKDENGYKETIKQHGKWNVNDFNYGLMAYVGFRSAKLVAKYDLQPVFKNNTTDQRYWSLGIQLDLR